MNHWMVSTLLTSGKLSVWEQHQVLLRFLKKQNSSLVYRCKTHTEVSVGNIYDRFYINKFIFV